MASAPDGKAYIGQTTQAVKQRWAASVSCAKAGANNCPLLFDAIRRHGAHTFVITEVHECPDEDLNFWEAVFIRRENTLAPSGLNVDKGGHAGLGRSNLVKRMDNQEQLPTYITKVFHDHTVIGYRAAHPMAPEKRFISADLPNNLARALAYWEECEALDHRRQAADRSAREKYIQKHANGWRVAVPGHSKKYFVAKTATSKENYERALQYVHDMNTPRAPEDEYIRTIKAGFRVVLPGIRKHFVAASKTTEEKRELAVQFVRNWLQSQS